VISHNVGYLSIEGSRSKCLVKDRKFLGKRVGVKNSLLSGTKTSIEGKFRRASKRCQQNCRENEG
jgi:hypothetical protein